MHRRLVLAVVLVALAAGFAGCSEASAGELSMRAVDDAALAGEASRDVPDDERVGWIRDLVLGAVENGSTTVDDTRPPFDPDLPLAHEGAYYELTHTVVGTTPGYTAELEVDFDEGAANGSVVAFADLPAVDRRWLGPLLAGERDDDRDGYDTGVRARYTSADANRSVLVPTQRYDAVTYEGATYPIRVGDVDEVTLQTYRYEATQVAPNASAYADRLTERYAFALSGLSKNETDVVESAIGDRYRAEDTDDAAFASLLDRFLAEPAVRHEDDDGSWIVRYEGQRYWVELSYYGFAGTEAVTPPSATPPLPEDRD